MAEKQIGYFPGWSAPEPETDYIWFNAPIEIGGVTETGLVLHGGCYANRPDSNVSLELRISKIGGRRCIPIERLDWRAMEGHSNRRKPKSAWSGKRVSETHLHDFYLNWSENEQRMRLGGLTVAREINEDVSDFLRLRDYFGKRLKINNIEVISEPEWVYDFFNGGSW
ncbi:hypothetical protein [Martelella sp. AD-3]|uniref:hypothetical protein n=2 Tax=Martelella sp. AD-3 TaxID=686597 RepID=UPI0012E7FC20|nr:hypothetical protein [Martelella sp. AD-3]